MIKYELNYDGVKDDEIEDGYKRLLGKVDDIFIHIEGIDNEIVEVWIWRKDNSMSYIVCGKEFKTFRGAKRFVTNKLKNKKYL